MQNKYFLIFCYLFLFTSCNPNDRNDEIIVDTETTDSKIYKFSFNNYKVNDIKLYKGPNGNSININEELLKTYWETYDNPTYKDIILDFEKNTLRLTNAGTLSDLTFPMRLKNDSIYVKQTEYYELCYGIYNKNNNTVKFNYYNHIYTKIIVDQETGDNLGLSAGNSKSFGAFTYNDAFKPYFFESPSKLTNKNDKVFWANVSYFYHLK